MKTRLSLICIAITMFLSVSIANAQHFGRLGSGPGGQQSAFQAVQGDLLQPGLPGRLWFSTNFADEGLGYNGSYLTLGGKTRLFQDRLDGRWLFEGQVHQSIEDDGGFFANVGIERVFSIEPANADISVGIFYDYDGDDQQVFSDGFNQLGITTAIKTRRFDFISNGYFPVNTKAFTLGDPTGVTNFVGNNVSLQPGIENALQGFDVTLRARPKQLAFANGYIDFGGYSYRSEDTLVDSFAGGRLRVGFQLINSLRVRAEVNQDDRFDTTGVLSASWTFGNTNSGFGSEYAGLARDLEKIVRNDHIVRFSQDLIVAINPLTGQPFNVVHANNTQNGTGDGTAESPFATLAEAEAASTVDDIIFVNVGDGTDTGYQDGITLQNRQQLLSSGGTQFIPEANGTLVALSTDGVGATISNSGGSEVVLLANNNTIGGINIDGTGATNGIRGDGISGGTFNASSISGSILDGIKLENIAGNFAFTGNTVSGNGQDGLFIKGTTDPTSNFTFTNNIFDANTRDGLHIANFEAESITITGNTTSTNGRHGLYLENDLNGNALGTDIDILTHTADANGANGIFVEDGSGRLQVLDATATNNGGAGLKIANFDNPLADDFTTIDVTEGNASLFTGNAIGIEVELLGENLTQNVLITQATIEDNARGITATSDGNNTTLNIDIIDNISISNHEFEGIRFNAEGGSTINNFTGSTDPNDLMPLLNNNNFAGGNIAYTLTGSTGDPLTEIISIVRNVQLDSSADGVFGIDVIGTENSRIDLDFADSLIDQTAGGISIDLDNDDNGSINRTIFDNLIIRSDVGIFLTTGAGTRTDFSVTRSTIESNGTTAVDGAGFTRAGAAGFGPFTDTQGDFGIVVSAFGADAGGGVFDNFTRINIADNIINDFTFEGITITGTGDAQILANIATNQINRNGPGQNDDPMNDDTFPGPNNAAVATDEEFFHHGIEINAFGQSVVSANILNNSLLDNFERAIQLNTTFFDQTLTGPGTASFFDQGTINVLIDGNRLASDIGLDNNNSMDPIPPINRIVGEIGVLNGMNANINLSASANVFEDLFTPIDLTNFNADSAVQIGLDGFTNGFDDSTVGGFFGTGGFTDVPFLTPFGLIEVENTFFLETGMFPVAEH